MNTTPATALLVNATAPASQYQVYRQNRAGQFFPGYRTDSAPEAVEAFLNQAPLFDGGEVRLFDHRSQRILAAVDWKVEKTEFGFHVHHRVNRFHDETVEQLAGEILARDTLRAELRREVTRAVNI